MISLRKITLASVVLTAVSIVACKSSKKSTSSTTSTTTTATTPKTEGPTSVGPLVPARSKEGVNPPMEEDLMALQKEFPSETLTKLNEGYELYTKGACVNCHNAKSIYKRDLASWKDIIDNMADRAKITMAQKDAVYKYVLAIKATQPK